MNDSVKNLRQEILYQSWSTLSRYSYDFKTPAGVWQGQIREAYNRGDGVTVLLLNPSERKLILTRQFRLPTYINGNESGMLIETCAGKLNKKEDPLEGMKREIEEETGHRVSDIKKVMEVYMSPGSVTEIIHFFIAQYSAQTKISAGGGLESEQENIEVLEMSFSEARQMLGNNQFKDAKTIMLLQHAALNHLI